MSSPIGDGNGTRKGCREFVLFAVLPSLLFWAVVIAAVVWAVR